MNCQRFVDLSSGIKSPNKNRIDIGDVQRTNINEIINNKHVKRIPVALVESNNICWDFCWIEFLSNRFWYVRRWELNERPAGVDSIWK